MNALKSDSRIRTRRAPTRTAGSSPRSSHYVDFWVMPIGLCVSCVVGGGSFLEFA
jgi:hypothetical protein